MELEPDDKSLSSRQASTKIPLLPLWATVGKAYSLAWGYRAEYIKIIWLWLIIGVPFAAIYHWYAWPYFQPLLCIDYKHLPDQVHMDALSHTALVVLAPFTLCRILIAASVAVAWHRLILRHEYITTNYYLRLDRVVASYFTVGVCLWILSMFGNVFTLIPDNRGLLMIAKGLLLLIASIGAILASTRLSIILPAKALARDEITIGEVWQKTGWNFWRLFWGYFLCILPAIPFSMATFFIGNFCESAIDGPLYYAFCWVLWAVFAAPVFLTFLSLSYQHFFERRDTA